jgi:DNA repair exonuclease SbcCD nuclease subunit
MKIAHIADIHSRDKDIEEIKRCLDFIIETATTEKVDLAVIAGDCFDSRDVKLDSQAAKTVIKFVSALADICPVAIVIGTPSHDGTAASILEYVKSGYRIFVATSPEQIFLWNRELWPMVSGGKAHVVISLIPQPTKQFFNQGDIQTSNEGISQGMNGLLAGMGAQAAEFDCPHILVGHWNVSGAKLSQGQTLTGQDIDISIDQMMLANPDLICLGHIHLPQQLGDRCFYGSSIYPWSWGENHKHGFYIHEIEAA